MITIEEANKLVCPFMTDKVKCITKECMAWKMGTEVHTYKDTNNKNHKFSYPDSDNIVDWLGYNNGDYLEWVVETDKGYCMRLGT